MAYVDLDKQIDIGGGAGGGGVDYETSIDGSLDLYTAQLKNYPVANARNDGTNDSQEFRGLQGVPSRDAQNTNWQGMLSYGIAQGTGALSRHSVIPMNKTVKKILSGNIQSSLYLKGDYKSFLTFGGTGGEITTSTHAAGSVTGKRYIVTSGGNKFIVSGSGLGRVYIDSCDNTGKITGHIGQLTGLGTSIGGNDSTYVVCAKGEYFWCVTIASRDNSIDCITAYKGYLCKLDSSGTGSIIDSETQITNSLGGTTYKGVTTEKGFGSYVYNNKAFCFVGVSSKIDTLYSRINYFCEIDLTNTTTFTKYIYKSYVDNVFGNIYGIKNNINMGYEQATSEIIFIDSAKNIQKVNSSGIFTDTGADFDGEAYSTLSSSSGSVSKLTTQSQRVEAAGTSLKIFGVNVNGSDVSGALGGQLGFIYEIDGTNTTDDGFLGCSTPFSCVPKNGIIFELYINSVLYFTDTIENWLCGSSSSFNKNASILNKEIGTTGIVFETKILNNTDIDVKIGFGLTGGNYDAPTGDYETSELNILM